MKAFLFAFAAMTACLLLADVNCFSEPDCSQGCDRNNCPEVPKCECGTYLDYCKCCSFCLKCPGQECSLVANEQCANGTRCKPPAGATAIMRINGPGKCV